VPKKHTSGTLALAGFDSIFQPTVTTQVTSSLPYINGGQYAEIQLSELYPPEFHPFQIREDVCYRGYGCVPYITLGDTNVCGTNGLWPTHRKEK
jgi:hypothetical protein